MKRKIFQSIVAFLVLACWSTHLHAQLYYPAYSELMASASTQVQVSNTGSSVMMYLGAPLRISVWDGQTPGFHFDYNNGAVTGEFPLQASAYSVPDIPFDPDVVIDVNYGRDIIIVYKWGTHIFREIWRFTGLTCMPVSGPTVVSSGALACQSPNIDQGVSTGAIVWEQGGRVLARSIDMATYVMGPQVQYGSCIPVNCLQPDVAVYQNGSAALVNVVFYTNGGNTQDLIIHRSSLSDLTSGVTPACSYPQFQVLSSHTIGTAYFLAPRVASFPFLTGSPHDPRDCEIVVGKILPSLNTQILGFNHRASAWGPNNYNPSILSMAPGADLTPCGNFLPAVSYVACDQIMVEWWYHPTVSGPCLPLPDQHILGRQLDLSGNPLYPNYSKIDWNTAYYKFGTPSVAGRYIAQYGPNGSILSTYSESMAQLMFYKYSDCNIPFLKTAASDNFTESKADRVFPNPFNQSFTIEWEINSDDPVQSIQLMDMAGRILAQKEVPSEMADWGSVEMGENGIPAGIYWVQLERASGNKMIKVIKQ